MLIDTVKENKEKIRGVKKELNREVEKVRKEAKPILEEFSEAKSINRDISTFEFSSKVGDLIEKAIPEKLRSSVKRTYVYFGDHDYITVGGASNLGFLNDYDDRKGKWPRKLYGENLIRLFTEREIWKKVAEYIPDEDKRERFERIGKTMCNTVNPKILQMKFNQKKVVSNFSKDTLQLLSELRHSEIDEQLGEIKEVNLRVEGNRIEVVAVGQERSDGNELLSEVLKMHTYSSEPHTALTFKDCLIIEGFKKPITELVSDYKDWVCNKKEKFSDRKDSVYQAFVENFPELSVDLL